MSAKHLFLFGYESPTEFRVNTAEGTDFESSSGIWIEADSAEAAAEWGRVLAQRYVAWLFEQAAQDGYLWDQRGLACWIEPDAEILRRAVEADMPQVLAGETPRFADMEPPATR